MHCELTIDLLPICSQIMEESLRKFAKENFGKGCFPALHGEIDKVQPPDNGGTKRIGLYGSDLS